MKRASLTTSGVDDELFSQCKLMLWCSDIAA